MKITAIAATVIITLALQPPLFAQSSAGLIAQTSDAAGGLKAFNDLGVLQMEISQVETYADGTNGGTAYTAYVDTNLVNTRLELAGEIISVGNGNTGWATMQGQPDIRQQTPRMAPAFNRERILPLLFPFTLNLEGLILGDQVDEVVFAKKPALRFSFSVAEMYFASPLMGLQWDVLVSPDDHRFIAARFLPVEGFAEAKNEGLQIEILETKKVNGVTLPTRIMMKGINQSGQPTGMEREVTIKTTVLLEPNPALFIRPDLLEALEEG